MDAGMLIVAVIMVVLLLPSAYSAWFTPRQYRKNMRKRRAGLGWHPESIFYGDLERHPQLDINLARAGYTLGLIFCLVLIIVALRGPF